MDRWDQVGRSAAYGAALALSPYLLIKVAWVVGSLVGVLPIGNGFGLAEWVVLNTVTVGMAVIGIALALALVRPRRLPLTFGWVGSGSLFAWSAWKLPLTLYVAMSDPADATPPEDITVAVVLHLSAVVAGAAMMRTLVRTSIRDAESQALREVASRLDG
ncbi:hypothetical protein [Streptomyces sp. NPDC001717]|uniref:hypothetical protein n=1 Tax=Streptomyces sp. NPDC001717 TaxID=3364604 RepID=UPI0036902DB6